MKSKLEFAGPLKRSGPLSPASLLEKTRDCGRVHVFHKMIDLICCSHIPRALVQTLLHQMCSSCGFLGSVFHGNMLHIQILGSYPKFTDLEALNWVPICLCLVPNRSFKPPCIRVTQRVYVSADWSFSLLQCWLKGKLWVPNPDCKRHLCSTSN